MSDTILEVLEHGEVLRQPDNVCGYSAWPSVCKDSEGNLVVACSGNRVMHVCPYGKVLIRKSKDEGKTWSAPIIAVDTPLDDRDAGILNLGNKKMSITTFNNTRAFQARDADRGVYGSEERIAMVRAYLPNVTDEMEEKYIGSLMSISEDDGFSWSQPFKVPVTAPHGPSLMKDGTMIYAGAIYGDTEEKKTHPIAIYKSKNYQDFEKIAAIPKCKEIPECLHCEPHILELPSGRLVVHIRVDEWGKKYEERLFSIVQTVSDDGGKTWSEPRLLGSAGAPPHLLQHSSGALICAYGKRRPTYGIQVMVSDDEGETWDMDHYIQEQGYDADIGYPCSVELENGDIFTVYYGKAQEDKMTSIFWTRWRLKNK